MQKQFILFLPEKPKKMKGDFIMGIVKHTLKTLPPVSKKDLERFDAIKEENIDCSDIPEITDSSNFQPYKKLPGLIWKLFKNLQKSKNKC